MQEGAGMETRLRLWSRRPDDDSATAEEARGRVDHGDDSVRANPCWLDSAAVQRREAAAR